MAEVMKDYKFNDKNRYPWDEWADGKIRRVKKGKDFHIDAKNFSGAARAYARKNEMKVKIAIEDPENVVFQFVK